MSDTNQERKRAVREAWKNEKTQVREGKGTRDWSQSEQKEIVAKGRANGYEGHHMKSVKDYPQHAGNSQNIQFLSRSEHVDGAHKGNTQNSTNGYYNPKTGTMHSFGNSKPQAPQSQSLSSPLTQRQQNLAVKREQAKQLAAKQAKTETKQAVAKTMPSDTKTQSPINNQKPAQYSQANSQASVTSINHATTNKGIESMKNQAVRSSAENSGQNKGIEAARQRAAETNTSKSSNKGISSYQSRVSGQSTNASISSTGGSVKGPSVSTGQSSGNISGAQSGGSGQGR